MFDFEQAGYVLDELLYALPDEIFKDLNGGVSLIEEAVKSDDGRYTLGTYFRNELGRYVELYYGSFVELYGEMDDELFKRRLQKTLHHELTHHIESMAWDRSLERWDERSDELCGFNGIEVESILFVDDDCSALAPIASAVFKANKAGYCDEVTSSYACIDTPAAELNKKAEKYVDFEISDYEPQTVTRELIEEHSIVLCMSISQADKLSIKYQDLDERIMCLAEDDIESPVLSTGWKKCIRRLNDEVLAVIDEIVQERQ